MRTLLLSLALIACNGPTDEASDDAIDTSTAPECSATPVSGTNVQTETFAVNVPIPTDITHAGDGSGRLFVTSQSGEILYFDENRNRFAFMDISSRVGYRSGSEQGLLSLTFHPDFEANGKFYVHYSDTSFNTTISEFTTGSDGLGDPTTERILLQADQPASNHNGGKVVFGPDGYLYIGLGDGGGGGDTYGNGQREDTFLSKILRIDVNDTSNGAYGIPSDNPFIGQGNHRPETWAWGLRNPWKFSFDRETGDMWIADVGQDQYEEIDIGVAGGNYGWSVTEGDNCFGGGGCDLSAFEAPIYEYGRSQGISIIGGYVYRGCAMPDLAGTYFLSDTPWFGNSPLWSLTWDGTGKAEQGPVWINEIVGRVTTMGEDEQGEIYIGEYTNGQIYKIVPAN